MGIVLFIFPKGIVFCILVYKSDVLRGREEFEMERNFANREKNIARIWDKRVLFLLRSESVVDKYVDFPLLKQMPKIYFPVANIFTLGLETCQYKT